MRCNVRVFLVFAFFLTINSCAFFKPGLPPGVNVKAFEPPHEYSLFQIEELCIAPNNIDIKGNNIQKDTLINLIRDEIQHLAKNIPIVEKCDVLHHHLEIKVNNLQIIKERPVENRIKRNGTLYIVFTLFKNQGEEKRILASNLYTLEKNYETWEWREEFLLSELEIKNKLIKDATRKWVLDHLPTVGVRYRYLKSKGPEVVQKTLGMIKCENCENAYNLLGNTYPELKSPSRERSYEEVPCFVLYHAGVACECVASKQAQGLDEIKPWLKWADIFYGRASMRATGDADIQRSAKDLSYAMELMTKQPACVERLVEQSW